MSMRPRLNLATRSVGWLWRRGAVLGEGRLELPAALENLSEVVVRLRMQRIQRERAPVGLRRVIPALLEPEQHAVIVVGIGDVDAERRDGLVVLLGLLPKSRCRP